MVSSEAGSVTAETAVMLPALAAVLSLSLWSVAAVGAQIRCVDASRTGARALARGELPARAMAAARATAPRGAEITMSRQGPLVVVDVRVRAALPGPWGSRGPGIETGSRAVAAAEE